VEVVLLENSPRLGLGEPLDMRSLRAHNEVVKVHGRHDTVQERCRLRSELPSFVVVDARFLPPVKLGDEVQAGREQLGAERLTEATLGGRWVQAEEFEVAAVVEDEEAPFVVPWPEEVRTEAGPTSDHLPELRLGADLLEEDEVDHVGHVDAGVEHVDRDGNVRCLGRIREVVDQRLGVRDAVMDRAGKGTPELRIVGIEALDDEVCMCLVLGEDDRLPDPVATCHPLAVSHEVCEHLVYRVFVEEPCVQRR
jgi:hypothetical protein